jgi:hypothetical protein
MIDTVNLNKIGKTDHDLNKRLNTYDTTSPDKVFVIDKVRVTSPIAVEHCVKAFLYDYRYRNNKEYYTLDVESIKKVIHKCNEFLISKEFLQKPKNIILHKSMDKNNVYGIMAITIEQEEDNKKYELKNNQMGGDIHDMTNEKNIIFTYYDTYMKNKYHSISLKIFY